MQKEVIITLFISVLLLLSLTTTALSEENDYYLVANTTSDADGNFVFEDIPQGNYTIIAINETLKSGNIIYYNKELDISVNETDIFNFNVSLDSGGDVDH
ncbi:MAG: hypothetical protein PWQ44_794, partial [Methanolobus sp.]|nr:hypothetical protein [Methanolobus sp.]